METKKILRKNQKNSALKPSNCPRLRKIAKKRRKGNKTMRRISNSSFNFSHLSKLQVSTPITVKRRTAKRKFKGSGLSERSKKRRKINDQTSDNSTHENNEDSELGNLVIVDEVHGDDPVAKDPLVTTDSLCGNNSENIVPDNNDLFATPSPSAKRCHLPAAHVQVKTSSVLSNLFRNDYIGVFDSKKKPRFLTSTVVPVMSKEDAADLIKISSQQNSSEDVIIIDDDEDEVSEKGCDEPNSDDKLIVDVGEDLLQLVTQREGGNLPDTNILDASSVPQKEQNLVNQASIETITLDDTTGKESVDSDSIMIVHENLGQQDSLQEIASKYFTSGVSMDFIPLNDSNSPIVSITNERGLGSKLKEKRIVMSKKKFKTKRATTLAGPSSFNPNKVTDINFVKGGLPTEIIFSSKFKKPQKKGSQSKHSAGATIYSKDRGPCEGLRPIVIDGSNIAFAHGVVTGSFSVKGIELVTEYFVNRGHKEVVAFLPQYRLKENPEVLKKMEQKGRVVFTPSRRAGNLKISSYDDRMILDYATEKGAIVISRDNYRDIYEEDTKYKETIENHILMPTFVGNTLMFPPDPLGRFGPRLDDFLKF